MIIYLCTTSLNHKVATYDEGASLNHVDRFLDFFDPPPPPNMDQLFMDAALSKILPIIVP